MDDEKPDAFVKDAALDDPAYQTAVFSHAYHQTRVLLNDALTTSDYRTLGQINTVRNQTIDQIAADFGTGDGAECGQGCSFCCHQMVLCTPLEIFQIAQQILDTKASGEIAFIKERLAKLAPLPLDEESRHGPDKPCALLENGGCSIYTHRPSLCRTMLSTSRIACEKSLNSEGQAIPFIAEPVVIAFLMQLGIDHALIKLKNLSTEKVEMSRALSIALANFDAAFQNWIEGRIAFPDCSPDGGNGPSYADFVGQAAARSGVA